MKIQIFISDGLTTQSRTFKQGVSLDVARAKYNELIANDYLELSYELVVDGVTVDFYEY